MPGDAHDTTPPPLPSVFVSYASSDRAAARALRDTLTAAGLEVWLDEDELGGGEAWDAKIRNQIRTCTYFMPVISATTETRREGYFRREWRLAVERTLDFADDVMFLVPVVIDETRDAGARVPEKFFTVQWLRVPGGQTTPALQDLARKLAKGEAVAIPPAAPLAPPAAEGSRKSRRAAEPPPPFPKFPAFPESGHRARFVYDLVLWFGHLIHALWSHLPRFVRVIAAMVIIFNLISWVFRVSQPSDTPRKTKSDIAAEVSKALGSVGSGARLRGKDRAAAAIESVVGTAAEALQAGRPVTLVTFSGEGDKAGEYAEGVFDEVCSLLQKDGKPQWGLSPLPLKPDASDAEVVSRGLRMKSRFVLTGHAGVPIPGLAPAFTARLFEVGTGQMVWKETFETAANEPDTVAQRIAAEVMKRLEPSAPSPTTPRT
ncbi:MAG TPA: toll/interleukin-1 receptor domain-containing protein [Lacunisphaera sp.]|nr:toll/interleukin-1 receptor domain-containing protein [Lacunisphaera sp.]